MNKQETINCIIGEKYTGFTTDEAEAYNDGINTALKYVKQIDEPEKPIVPRFVAEWLDVCKENLGFDLASAMSHSTSAMQRQPSKVQNWFNSKANQETFAKAWLYGRKVEKLYTAQLKSTGEYLHYDIEIDKIHHFFAYGKTAKNSKAYHFTKGTLIQYSAWKNEAYDVKEVKE